MKAQDISILPAKLEVGGNIFIMNYEKPPAASSGSYISVEMVVTGPEGLPGRIDLSWDPEYEPEGKNVYGRLKLKLVPSVGVTFLEWVESRLRGIGLARAMIACLEEELRTQGFKMVVGTCFPDIVEYMRELGYIVVESDYLGLNMVKDIRLSNQAGEGRGL